MLFYRHGFCSHARVLVRSRARRLACSRVLARVRACSRMVMHSRKLACSRVHALAPRACSRAGMKEYLRSRVRSRARACSRLLARSRSRVLARARARAFSCARGFAYSRVCVLADSPASGLVGSQACVPTGSHWRAPGLGLASWRGLARAGPGVSTARPLLCSRSLARELARACAG